MKVAICCVFLFCFFVCFCFFLSWNITHLTFNSSLLISVRAPWNNSHKVFINLLFQFWNNKAAVKRVKMPRRNIDFSSMSEVRSIKNIFPLKAFTKHSIVAFNFSLPPTSVRRRGKRCSWQSQLMSLLDWPFSFEKCHLSVAISFLTYHSLLRRAVRDCRAAAAKGFREGHCDLLLSAEPNPACSA